MSEYVRWRQVPIDRGPVVVTDDSGVDLVVSWGRTMDMYPYDVDGVECCDVLVTAEVGCEDAVSAALEARGWVRHGSAS